MAGTKGKSGGARANSGGPRKNAGGSRPGAGRPKKPIAALAVEAHFEDPLEFLREVMNDKLADPKLRVDAAKAMAPFIHSRKGEGGKKEAKNDAAKRVASKFATPAPPRLVVDNAKR